MRNNKTKKNIQTTNTQGNRRCIEGGGLDISVNSRSLESVIDKEHTPHNYRFVPSEEPERKTSRKSQQVGYPVAMNGEFKRVADPDELIRNAQSAMGRLSFYPTTTYHDGDEEE